MSFSRLKSRTSFVLLGVLLLVLSSALGVGDVLFFDKPAQAVSVIIDARSVSRVKVVNLVLF